MKRGSDASLSGAPPSKAPAVMKKSTYGGVAQAGVTFYCECGNKCRSDSHFRSGKCLNVSISIIHEEVGGNRGKEKNHFLSDMRAKKTSTQIANEQMGSSDSDLHGSIREEEMRGIEGIMEEKEEEEVEKSSDASRCVFATPLVRRPEMGTKSSRRKGAELAERQSMTAMKCLFPECIKFSTRSVTSFMTHLRLQHSSSPKQEGIIFHCECGHKSHSDTHYRYGDCRNVAITIIREGEENGVNGGEKNDERRLDGRDFPSVGRSTKTSTETMKCIKCTFETHSVQYYTKHIKSVHGLTAIQAGIGFKC